MSISDVELGNITTNILIIILLILSFIITSGLIYLYRG